ncbi:MAG TPA: Wzz/FepE/Etk N-terminal domain-containing protein [Streptosporangiaceae bacterium]
MSVSQRPESFELSDYLGVLRRRWKILVIVTVVGIVGSLGYLYAAPKVYTASAEVSVTPTGSASSQQSGAGVKAASPVNMDNEAQLVQSQTVATAAARLLDSPLTPEALSRQVTVNVPANSQILQVSCDSSTASGSAQCANAFAQAYLANRQATAAAAVASQLKSLQRQIDTVTKKAAALTAKIASLPPNSQQRAIDQALYSSDSSQLRALSNQAAALTGAGANSSGGSIIGNASPPGQPSSPKRLLILPSGVVVGVLVALLLALFLDRRDERLHGPDDAERAIDAPVLLNLAQRKTVVPFGLLSSRSRAGHGMTELARGLAASLGSGHHVIFVTSASRGAAAAVTSTNLAAALARSYSDTILVTPNLHGSLVPQILGLDDGAGLVELLSGTVSLDQVARRPADIPRLRVVTPGRESTLSTTDFQFDAVSKLVSRLREESRYVIIEAEGGEGSTDAFAFAEFADAAVVVIEASRTVKSDAIACARRLDQVHTVLLGSVLMPPIEIPARWRAEPVARVRSLPDRTDDQLTDLQPRVSRARPASRAEARPSAESRPSTEPRAPSYTEPRPPGRPESKPTPGPAIPRLPRELNQTWPFPKPGLPSEEDKPRGPRSGSERPHRPADTGTG